MASSCCGSAGCAPNAVMTRRYRRALCVALFINLAMFAVELAGGWNAGSASLLADAVDFLGDAANYALSLAVLSMAMVWRSRTALIKGLTMGVYGLFVLGRAAWIAVAGAVPHADTMGVIGGVALAANLSVAALLYAYRQGDANMRSVWLCSRNDAIGNLAILFAAAGVLGTRAAWPDLIVATVMAGLGLAAARSVIMQALAELQSSGQPVARSTVGSRPAT